MKIITMIAATMLSTASFAAETTVIDGCAATKVEGANYYNFDNPRCVTGQAEFASSGSDERRLARAEAERKAAANN